MAPEYAKEKANLVKLTAREHYDCHLLLTKMCIEKLHKGKMVNALSRMAFCNRDRTNIFLTSEECELVRKLCRESLLGNKINLGRFPNEQTRRKRGEASKRVVRTAEWRKKISEANKGKHVSAETKLKQSLIKRGKVPWHLVLLSKMRIGKLNPNSKRVSCFTCSGFYKEYESARQGALDMQLANNISGVCACCRGEHSYCGKHPATGEKLYWKYLP